MRHGWEWWEGLWNFVLDYCKEHKLVFDDGFVHDDAVEELQDLKKQWEEKWREGVVVPPNVRRQEE